MAKGPPRRLFEEPAPQEEQETTFLGKILGQANPTQNEPAIPSSLHRPPAISQLEEQAKSVADYYQAVQAQHIEREDILAPVEEEKNPVVDIGNILLHDEMAAAGVSLDTEGLHWSLDRAKAFWSEHPIRAGVATALTFAPILGGIAKARRASKLAGITDADLLTLGLVDNVDDAVRMSKADRDMLRMQAYDIDRHTTLRQKVFNEEASQVDKAIYRFQENFGNSYLERVISAADNPWQVSKEYAERMQGVVTGGKVSKLFDDMPEEALGLKIRQVLLDPSQISSIPEKHRPWVKNLMEWEGNIQRQAVEEGFISEAAAKRVGDFWFPTIRKGTPLHHEGPTTTVLLPSGRKGAKAVNVPRTSSPFLRPRTTSKEGIQSILNKEEAARLLRDGKRDEAISILKKEKADDLVELLNKGEDTKVKGIIGQEALADTTTSGLVVKGMLQQSLLFENFRYLRDIALNPLLHKTAADIAPLSAGAKKKWHKLADLPRADIIQRMAAKKAGDVDLSDIFIHENLWSELADATTGQPVIIKGLADFVETMTAIHKVNKVAFNPFTQMQNITGNYLFALMRGFNLFDSNGHELLWKKAAPAIWKLQRAARKGKPVEEIGNLGVVKSKIGGRDLDIAEELNRAEVGEIIERSSLVSAEGIETLTNLSKRTKDTQSVVRNIIRATQGAVEKTPILNKAVDSYMAGDGMFKLAYFLDLRSRGFNPTSAAVEVAKTFPIYHTVGSTFKQFRTALFPWISFPAEASRVVKNNLIDFPLRTAMLMHSVDFMQALLYPALDMGHEGIQDVKAQTPVFAQRPRASIVTPFKDSNNDIRTAVLDFLPWSSMLPPTDSPHASAIEKLPLGMNRFMPILNGLTQAVTGRGPYGQDIPTEPNSIADKLRITTLGTLGFVAPPLLEKYLLSTTAPTPTYRIAQDLGQAANPYTTKPGDAFFDFFVNNFGGAGITKMYSASPEQELASKASSLRKLQQYRSKLTRNWNAFIRSGDWESASRVMADIHRTFSLEWSEPGMVQSKFNDWVINHRQGILKHPQLRGFSEERFIDEIRRAQGPLGTARTNARQALIDSMRREIGIRKGASKGNPTSGGGSVNPVR